MNGSYSARQYNPYFSTQDKAPIADNDMDIQLLFDMRYKSNSFLEHYAYAYSWLYIRKFRSSIVYKKQSIDIG